MATKPKNPSLYQRWTDPSNGNEFQYLGKSGWKMTKKGNRAPSTTPTSSTSTTVTTPIVTAPPATAPRKLTWTDIYSDPALTEGADISAGSSLSSLFSKYGLTISPTGQVRAATTRELFNPVEAGGLAADGRQLVVGGQVVKGIEDVVGKDTNTTEANQAGLSGSVLGDLIVAIRRNAILAGQANSAGGVTGGAAAGGADIRKSGEQGSWNKFIQDLMSGISGIGTARTGSLTDLLQRDVVEPDTAAAAPPAAPAATPERNYAGYERPAAGSNLSAGRSGDFIRLVEDISVDARKPEAGISKPQRKAALLAMKTRYTLSAQQKKYIDDLIKSGNY